MQYPDSSTSFRSRITYDTFGAYVRGELKCEECGKPLALKKGKSGKFFLVCSDTKCRTFVWIEPQMVDDYLYFGNILFFI